MSWWLSSHVAKQPQQRIHGGVGDEYARSYIVKHLEGCASPWQHWGCSSRWYIDAVPARPDLIINSSPQIIYQITRGIIHLFAVCSGTSYRNVSGVWLNATSVPNHESTTLLMCMVNSTNTLLQIRAPSCKPFTVVPFGAAEDSVKTFYEETRTSLVRRLHHLSSTRYRFIGIRRKTNRRQNTEGFSWENDATEMILRALYRKPLSSLFFWESNWGNTRFCIAGHIHVLQLPKADGLWSIKVKPEWKILSKPFHPLHAPRQLCLNKSGLILAHALWIGRLDHSWGRDQCLQFGQITGWEN